MNRADMMIRRYLFIDVNSLFANAERAFLLLGKGTIFPRNGTRFGNKKIPPFPAGFCSNNQDCSFSAPSESGNISASASCVFIGLM